MQEAQTMKKHTEQVQGDEVRIGFPFGRAPLALRGIRFADGDEENGAGAGAGGDPKPTPTPTPTPPKVSAPEKPSSDWYSKEYVTELRGEAKANRETAEQHAANLAAIQAERDELASRLSTFEQAEAERTRVSAITEAAKDLANAEGLLDSLKFTKHLEGVELDKPESVRAAVESFIAENPNYAIKQSTDGKPPARQHGAPGGSSAPSAPTSLGSAIGAHFAR